MERAQATENTSAIEPTIAAAMIVKNGEEFIERCIESIYSLVDYIAFIDTGSTDLTLQTVAQFDKVHVSFFTWTGNYSEARNYSLSQVPPEYDYILWIDHDEELETKDIPVIREAMRQGYNSIWCVMLNEAPDGRTWHPLPKIFKNNIGVYFEQPAQEYPVIDGTSIQTQVRFYHHGYNLPWPEMLAKFEERGAILEKLLEEKPDSGFAMYRLVRNYRARQMHDKAIALAQEYQDKLTKDEVKSTAHIYRSVLLDYAMCLYKQERYDEAEGALLEILSKYASHIDATYLLALIYWVKKDYEQARAYFEKHILLLDRLKKVPRPDAGIVDTWNFIPRSQNFLGLCHDQLGDKASALMSYRSAIQNTVSMDVYENYQNMLPKIADDRRLNILFVQGKPCMRNRKESIALRERGHRVSMVYTAEDNFVDEDIYDERMHISDLSELVARCADYDLVHVHNPPDNLAVVLSEYVLDTPIIHDVHDLIELWHPLNSSLAVSSMTALRHSSARVFSTPQQLGAAKRMYDMDLDYTAVLLNLTSGHDIPLLRKEKLSQTVGGFHVVYEGAVGHDHMDMMNIFQQIAEREIHLHIYPMMDAPEYREWALNFPYMHYHDTIPAKDLVYEMTQYDAGIVPWNLENGTKEFVDTCIANKASEYVAAGLPIIVCNSTALKWFVETYEIGMVYDTVDDIVDGLEMLGDLDVSSKNLTMESQIARLIGLYHLVLQRQHEIRERSKSIVIMSEQQQARSIERQFPDRLSEVYLGQTEWDEEARTHLMRRVDTIIKRARGKVLDIGCADGFASIAIASSGHQVVGVDMLQEHIDRANENLKYSPTVETDYASAKAFYQRIVFLRANAESLPFSDNEFDTVILGEVLEHVIDPESALQEARRVMAPSGQLLCSVPIGQAEHPGHRRFYDRDSFIRQLEALFHISEIEEYGSNILAIAHKEVNKQWQQPTIMPQSAGVSMPNQVP